MELGLAALSVIICIIEELSQDLITIFLVFFPFENSLGVCQNIGFVIVRI